VQVVALEAEALEPLPSEHSKQQQQQQPHAQKEEHAVAQAGPSVRLAADMLSDVLQHLVCERACVYVCS